MRIGVEIDSANYTFNALAKTITFTGITGLSLESFSLITNVEQGDNVVIYQFQKLGKGATFLSDVLTLEYDTTGMSNLDSLKINISVDSKEISYGATLTNPTETGLNKEATQELVLSNQTNGPQKTQVTDGLVGVKGKDFTTVVKTNNPLPVEIQGTVTETNSAAILASLDTLKTYTDGIEALLAAIDSDELMGNASLLSILASINTLNTYVDNLESYTDGIEGILTTTNSLLGDIKIFTDGIESLQGITNSLITTLNTYVDGLEGLLTSLNTKDFATETTLALIKTKTDNLDVTLSSRLNTLGQKTSANSAPVVIASDQSPISVTTTNTNLSTITGTLNAIGSVTLPLPGGVSGIAINFINSAFIGTVMFESSEDGGITYNPRVYRGAGILNNLQTTIVNSATQTQITGDWRGNGAEMTHIRVRCTSYTSGSLSVVINAGTGVGAVFLNAAIPIGGQSVGNVFASSLSAGSSFTGTYENLENVASIAISLSINQNGTIQFYWSQDGITDFKIDTAIAVTSGVPFFELLNPGRCQYFKIVVTNTSGATAFQVRLETVYRAAITSSRHIQINSVSNIKDDFLSPLELSQGIMKVATNSYAPIQATATTGSGATALKVGNAVEDTPHVAGDVGDFILGVSNEARTSLVNADGDYTPIGTNTRGSVYTVLEPPLTTSILSASATVVGTLITIPANKIWRGTVTVSATITAALNAAAANGNVRVTFTPGTGGTTAYTIAQVMLSTPVIGLTSLVGVSNSGTSVVMDVEVYAGTTAGTIALAQTSMTQFFSSVSGKIIN